MVEATSGSSGPHGRVVSLIIGAVVVIFGGSRSLNTRETVTDSATRSSSPEDSAMAHRASLHATGLRAHLFRARPAQSQMERITPGSAIGVILWLLVSFAFKGYLHFFDTYSKTYGSLEPSSS
jgi:uncharacterized BrkB/YihY/UPF0761 family membrane protein